MKRIAVLSSGTDNTGINAAIRAVVRSAPTIKSQILGVKWGFRGLLDDQFVTLSSRDVSGIIGKAGCFLGTSHPANTINETTIKTAMNNLKKRKVDAMIVIGGFTSIEISQMFAKNNLQTVSIPSTIQDDIPGTDISLGVDSAVNNIQRCVDSIRGCDSSRNRTFLVGVDGKSTGHLALRAAAVTGAEFCFINEIGESQLQLPLICKAIADASLQGKKQTISIVSSGCKPSIDDIEKYLNDHSSETDLYVRKAVLGYVQRGGAPSAYDRLLGTRFGAAAIAAIGKGESSVMVGLSGNSIKAVPYESIIGQKKPIDDLALKAFKMTR